MLLPAVTGLGLAVNEPICGADGQRHLDLFVLVTNIELETGKLLWEKRLIGTGARNGT